MLTGPEGLRRAIVRAASASVGNGNASFFSPQAAVGNLRVSQTECPPGYETRITNIANLPAYFVHKTASVQPRCRPSDIKYMVASEAARQSCRSVQGKAKPCLACL